MVLPGNTAKDGKFDIVRIRPLARMGPIEDYALADRFKRGMSGEAKGRVASER